MAACMHTIYLDYMFQKRKKLLVKHLYFWEKNWIWASAISIIISPKSISKKI